MINFFILGGITGASLLGLAVMLSIRRDAEDAKPIEIHIVFDDSEEK